MEAYYHSDPRLEEWVKQIVEKIFTTCLLSGVDSDAEYQSGCQLIEKIASLLQGFSPLPPEYLADGLKQIIEQQLPDSRVMSNFPTFQETMNKMLHDGVLKVINDSSNESELFEEIQPQPAIASVYNSSISLQIEPILERTEITIDNESSSNLESKLEESNIENISKMDSSDTVDFGKSTQVPLNSERLNNVLNYLFPNASIQWNYILFGQNFLAQVEDILIYCSDTDHPFEEEKYNRDGWRIMLVSEEDLAYPRRLERKVKTILRMGKKTQLRI